jgi:hypothetical protein
MLNERLAGPLPAEGDAPGSFSHVSPPGWAASCRRIVAGALGRRTTPRARPRVVAEAPSPSRISDGSGRLPPAPEPRTSRCLQTGHGAQLPRSSACLTDGHVSMKLTRLIWKSGTRAWIAPGAGLESRTEADVRRRSGIPEPTSSAYDLRAGRPPRSGTVVPEGRRRDDRDRVSREAGPVRPPARARRLRLRLRRGREGARLARHRGEGAHRPREPRAPRRGRRRTRATARASSSRRRTRSCGRRRRSSASRCRRSRATGRRGWCSCRRTRPGAPPA